MKPVFGRGGTRLLYRGPVEEDGRWLTEDDIADAVARNSGFWEYVAAQVRAKRIQEQDGVWSFKLSVSFLDQTGSPAVLDEVKGLTARITAEAWEFHQLAGGGAPDGRGDPVTLAMQCVRDLMAALQQQHAHALRESRELMAESVRAAQGTLAAASAEASRILAAGAEPLRHAVDRVVDHAKAETVRANDATKDMVKLLIDDGDDSSVLDTVTKLSTALPVVIPLAKKALDGLKN